MVMANAINLPTFNHYNHDMAASKKTGSIMHASRKTFLVQEALA